MEIEGDTNILTQLRPPRLEDAGLEDCALPPDAIKEAFFKAATAVKSRVSSLVTGEEEDDDDDGGGYCVMDPTPPGGDSIESLIALSPVTDPHQRPCAGEKCGGGIPEVLGDEVAADVTGAELKVDKAVGGTKVEEGAGKSCVDGLQGLDIGDERKKDDGDDDDDDGDGERPILVEGSA